MSRNGAGVYTLPAGNPVVNLTPITPAWANSTLSDIGNEITNSIDKAGRTTPTANLPMGGFKWTGAGSGTAAGDLIAFGQGLAQLGSLGINTVPAYPLHVMAAGANAVVMAGSTDPSGAQVYIQANGATDVRVGSFTNHPLLFVTNGVQRGYFLAGGEFAALYGFTSGADSYVNGNLYVSASVVATLFTGTLAGNASSATVLQTARLINGISFNGSANVVVPPFINPRSFLGVVSNSAANLAFADAVTYTERYDANNDFNNTTGQFVCPVSGTYMFGYTAYCDSAGVDGNVRIAVNGVTFYAQTKRRTGTIQEIWGDSTQIELNATDVVTVQYTSSAGTMRIMEFWGKRVV